MYHVDLLPEKVVLQKRKK